MDPGLQSVVNNSNIVLILDQFEQSIQLVLID